MAGLKTTLQDLKKSLQEYERKKSIIEELKKEFMKEGFSPFMAHHLAQEKYKQIHKNETA